MLKDRCYSKGNFAAKLAKHYYTEEERLSDCCVRGQTRAGNARPSISPNGRRLQRIIHHTKRMYNVPEYSECELKRMIVKKIDESNRHERRQAKKKLNI